MNFSQAFDTVRSRKNVCMRLPNWSPDVKIFCQFTDDKSKMNHPYLYVNSRYGNVPWMPTNVELFNNNWEVLYEDA